MNNSQLQKYLETWSETHPVSHWGATTLTKPLTLEFYTSWIDQGYHSTMKYLKDHLPLKSNPQSLGTKLHSALVFAFPYFPHPESEPFKLKELRTALYAQGEDYHFWIKKHLATLVENLKKEFPEEEFLIFTDSAPVMERDLAYRAGLGWIGKNTCLIDRTHGSLFLIGEIFTSLKVNYESQISADFCGKCQACIEICPTKALKSPKFMDAGKCISYLTIESREVPPLEIRSQIGDWFFGCDLCQTVCPWNQKVFKSEIKAQAVVQKTSSDRDELLSELRFVLTSSGKALTKFFAGTPLMRAGPFGLKRNALIVAGNLKLRELEPEVRALESHEKLGELANWTLNSFAE
jgi:epoxyqueuosine reductase